MSAADNTPVAAWPPPGWNSPETAPRDRVIRLLFPLFGRYDELVEWDGWWVDIIGAWTTGGMSHFSEIAGWKEVSAP